MKRFASLPRSRVASYRIGGLPKPSSKRADFLRSFGLARLPRDRVLCARAGEMLLAQQRPELALAAVDKPLLADPTDLQARRLRLQIQAAMKR